MPTVLLYCHGISNVSNKKSLSELGSIMKQRLKDLGALFWLDSLSILISSFECYRNILHTGHPSNLTYILLVEQLERYHQYEYQRSMV